MAVPYGIPILLYHRLGRPQGRSIVGGQYVSAGLFRKHMNYLVKAGYRSVSLTQVVGYMRKGVLRTPKPVAITFDDGYLSLYEHALPVLCECGLSATVFLTTDFVGKTNEWEQAVSDVCEPMLGIRQIEEMVASGIEMGSHTCGHVHLAGVSRSQAWREIAASKHRLEDMLGRPCLWFAYPYGEYTPEVRDLVDAAGYEGACSTLRVANRPGGDPFKIGRINVRRYNWVPRLRLKLWRAQRVGGRRSG